MVVGLVEEPANYILVLIEIWYMPIMYQQSSNELDERPKKAQNLKRVRHLGHKNAPFHRSAACSTGGLLSCAFIVFAPLLLSSGEAFSYEYLIEYENESNRPSALLVLALPIHSSLLTNPFIPLCRSPLVLRPQPALKRKSHCNHGKTKR